MRLVDDRVIATSSAALRRLARVLLARGASRGLLTFGVADTHVHAVLACDRATAGVFAQTVEASLRAVLALPVPFEAARIRPVLDQRHLAHAARYASTQDMRHDLASDPLREGTALQDLVGLRVLAPDLATRVAMHLPRWSQRELASLLEVDLGPWPLDHGGLADAAAATLALPHLRGLDPETTAARRAAVHVALGAGLRPREIGEHLSVTARTVQRLSERRSPQPMVRAVTLQLRLRAAIAARESEPLTAAARATRSRTSHLCR
jgi:hypothetical protein